MSLEECHAPTISSVIFIYAHAMVYINLQSLLKFESIFSVCLEQFGGGKLQKMFKNDDFALKRDFWSFSGPYSVPMRENMDQKNSEYGHILRSYCYYS